MKIKCVRCKNDIEVDGLPLAVQFLVRAFGVVTLCGTCLALDMARACGCDKCQKFVIENDKEVN